MKKICVYCGVNSGKGTVYLDACRDLGKLLAARGFGLVYGGGHLGMMGALANAVLDNGGEATGVITELLSGWEQAHTGLDHLHTVRTMAERKNLMRELADGFIAMPGGLGTHDELFEVLVGLQLGEHDKPCIVLNINGFYDHLRVHLDHAVAEGLLLPEKRRLVIFEEDIEEALRLLHNELQ